MFEASVLDHRYTEEYYHYFQRILSGHHSLTVQRRGCHTPAKRPSWGGRFNKAVG